MNRGNAAAATWLFGGDESHASGKRVACAKLRGQEPQIGPIGGETDAQGCYISAGYSWCASSEKCIRTWETECPA